MRLPAVCSCLLVATLIGPLSHAGSASAALDRRVIADSLAGGFSGDRTRPFHTKLPANQGDLNQIAAPLGKAVRVPGMRS